MAISYVGGITGKAGDGGQITLDLTALTGGSAGSPSAGDIVIVALASGATAQRTLSLSTADYNTLAAGLYADDTYDTNLYSFYKIMGSTPDTSLVTNGSGSVDEGLTCIAYVWRGVSTTTPFDVTTTTATGVNVGRPSPPPAITPVTTGAVMICMGAAALDNLSGLTFTATELTSFIQVQQSELIDSRVGIGYRTWSSGTYTPANWGGGSTSTSASWCAVTMALRPTAAGPANLKTYNTNTKANIKTINTNVIANVKTLDTNA